MKLRELSTPNELGDPNAIPLAAPEMSLKSKLRLVSHVRPYQLIGKDEPHAYVLLEFLNREGKIQYTMIPAGYLIDPPRFRAHLASRFFDWSSAPDVKQVLEYLNGTPAPTDGLFTIVPGWHGDRYARGPQWIAREGQRQVLHFYAPEAVKLPAYNVCGSLKEWQQQVAIWARRSSNVRFAIALVFAALVMRLVRARPFGVNFVGPSSIGKTLLLLIMASIIGAIGEEGLPHLGSSLAAIEQMRLGGRDSVTLIDEVGHIFGDPKTVAAALKRISFLAGTARGSDRASSWERATMAAKADCPTVVAITSEVAIASLVQNADLERLPGEAVRLIDQPAVARGATDIFDGKNALGKVGRTVDERRATVTRIEDACHRQQGVAQIAFLNALLAEGLEVAEGHLRQDMAEFNYAVNSLQSDRMIGRITSAYALSYAAACLAIRYGVLKWSRKNTLRDLRRCLTDAIEEMNRNATAGNQAVKVVSDNQLIEEFNAHIASANIVKIILRKGAKPSKSSVIARRKADALRACIDEVEYLLLSTERLKEWEPDGGRRSQLLTALRSRRALRKGRSETVWTGQYVIPGLEPARQGFYAIRLDRLMQAE